MPAAQRHGHRHGRIIPQGTLAAVSKRRKPLRGARQLLHLPAVLQQSDLFDQAGIAYPTNDWTWADAQAAAEKIRALGDDIWGYSQPITYNEFYKSIAGNGGSITNADGTAFTVNSPENVAVLDAMIARVRGENHVMPTAEEMAGRGDWDMFVSGNLGMIITGIWAFPYYTENCDFPLGHRGGAGL